MIRPKKEDAFKIAREYREIFTGRLLRTKNTASEVGQRVPREQAT